MKKVNWESKTILIVEDTPSSNMYFEAVLSETKAKLIWTDNGEDACNISAENKDIDVVLMDMRLPVMSGFAATEKIRQIRPDLPIIAQSAYVNSGEKQRSMEIGCNDFLPKPVSVDKLLTTIEKYLTKTDN